VHNRNFFIKTYYLRFLNSVSRLESIRVTFFINWKNKETAGKKEKKVRISVPPHLESI